MNPRSCFLPLLPVVVAVASLCASAVKAADREIEAPDEPMQAENHLASPAVGGFQKAKLQLIIDAGTREVIAPEGSMEATSHLVFDASEFTVAPASLIDGSVSAPSTPMHAENHLTQTAQAVPEPTVALLLSVAASALLLVHRHRRVSFHRA